MIRKGIRPRFRLALDRPAPELRLRRVYPFRRSWLAIGILAAFDLVFLIPAITTFRTAADSWGRFEDLFDLVGALFLSAWLLGWSIAPILMTTILVLMLFGREVIKARPGTVELFLGLPLIGVAAEYQAAGMRNLRLQQAPEKSGRSWRGTHLQFDYGANSVAFGSDVDERELTTLANDIHMASGQAIRRGEATADELAGRWPTDPVIEAVTTSEQHETQMSEPMAPITLASPSALALIIANLIPLAGAVFLGWDLAIVMVLYWSESAIIGLFNICKMAVVSKWVAIPAGLFFLSHFGAFMAVHFLFLYALFIQGPQDMSGGDLAEVGQLFISLWPALLALVVSHGLSFYQNFLGRGEYRGRALKEQMTEPYSRIIFMHLVLIFGGGLTLVLGEPTPVLLIVIVLKILFDVKAHLKQHAVR